MATYNTRPQKKIKRTEEKAKRNVLVQLSFRFSEESTEYSPDKFASTDESTIELYTPSEIPHIWSWIGPYKKTQRFFLFIWKISPAVKFNLSLIEDDTAILVESAQNLPESVLSEALDRASQPMALVEGLNMTTRVYRSIIRAGHLLLEPTYQEYHKNGEEYCFVSWQIHHPVTKKKEV
jgi:hypothetical protein